MSSIPQVRERSPRQWHFRIAVPLMYVQRSCRGLGMTCNMSRQDISIKTDQILQAGKRVQLLIDWPVKLDRKRSLCLVVVGKVLYSGLGGTAVRVWRQDYRLRPKAS